MISMSHNDRQVIDAIYTGGVLKPLGPLSLMEKERVRLSVEKLTSTPSDRAASIREFREGIDRMEFRSDGRYPSRNELHDRD